MGTLKVLNLILPLVTMPYLIKILGLASYGAIFMAISLLVFFQSIVDYGFDISATRDLAKCSDDHLEIERIYSTILM
ncbi:oligosaccharide flippase family protein, partial [Acinetobacter gerneri]|uniref:oligosaccharide flippase family protein n=1 Tax=Acinetobacter gerneri TaxID=202952 RepID=UPI0029359450